jgi:putative FmdB family regulatory protein
VSLSCDWVNGNLGYTSIMPTYEYACTSCGQHVEIFQRLAEPPLDTCVACGGHMRKVFFPAGIVFKGSGFYATDSRSKSKSSASSDSGSGSSGSSGSDSGSGSGSDAKKTDSSKDGSSGPAKPSSGSSDSKPAPKPAAKEKSA